MEKERKQKIEKLLKKQKAYMRIHLNLAEKIATLQMEILEELANVSLKAGNNEKEYLNIKEVCKLLNVSASTLFRMRVNSEIPFIKLEGRKNIMFDKKDIEEFMKGGKG